MPASTTAKSTARPKTPEATPTALQFNDALEKAKTRVLTEFASTSHAAVIELACKLMTKYTREELKL